MNLLDVNILVHAHRLDSDRNPELRKWLENETNKEGPWALSEIVLSGFLRIVTHRRIFKTPTPLEVAIKFIDSLVSRPNCILVKPGDRHWEIFMNLCKKSQATGNLIPDAYLAALAIESGCVWVTTDSDFARFPSLKWINPLH